MIPVTYKFKNFSASLYEYQGDTYLNVTCQLDGKPHNRVYDIDQEISSIDIDEEYIYLNFDDGQYVIKFEGQGGLVIDIHSEDGDSVETFGYHDFWEEVSFF